MIRQRKITEVKAAEKPRTLVLRWSDGTSTTLDLTPLIPKFETLAPLEDREFFGRVEVGEWGWSAKWSDDVELSSETLWRGALEQRGDAMPVADFNAWRDRHNLSLTKTAEALGLSRRVVAYYARGSRIIPKTVLLATQGYEVAIKRNTGRRRARGPKPAELSSTR